MAVLPRPAGDLHPVAGDEQVVVGRGQQDRAGHEPLAAVGVPDGQRAALVHQVRQDGRGLGGLVQHDEDRGRQVGLEAPGELEQRLHATGRGADPDHGGHVLFHPGACLSHDVHPDGGRSVSAMWLDG